MFHSMPIKKVSTVDDILREKKKKAKPRIWEWLLAEDMKTRSKVLLDSLSGEALQPSGTTLSSHVMAGQFYWNITSKLQDFSFSS